MPFISLSKLPSVEILPGFNGKFIHTPKMSIGYWNIKAGSLLSEHEHVHEQVTHILEGQFEMTIDGKAEILEKGKVAVIPPGVKHSGKAITDCLAIDVFHPVREDYKSIMEQSQLL